MSINDEEITVTDEVWSLIPARGGSKGIPKKNIIDINGYPLISYSIIASLNSKRISRTFVTTDSPEIAEISRSFGADVPFLRPSEFATDKSTDIDFVMHFLNWSLKEFGKIPKYLLNLRPTTPLRDPKVIDQAIEKMMDDDNATSLRSVHESVPPQKMMKFDGPYLTGFFPDDKRVEYYNLPRQVFPKAYQPNGYIDIFRSAYVLENRVLYGNNILGFVTEYVDDLDTLQDLHMIRDKLKLYDYPLAKYIDSYKNR